MRLWKIAFATTLFFSLACGDMGGMIGGGGGDDAKEQDDDGKDGADEEEDEEEVADEEPEKEKKPPAEKQECSVAALQKGAGAARGTGKPQCLGRWGAADLSTGNKGIFEFEDGWKLVEQGKCTKPTDLICNRCGFK